MAGTNKTKAFRRSEVDVVALKAQEERADIWTALPGRIKSFNPEAQTATVEVMYKPRHNGKPVAMPDLLEVPVVLQRGGGFAFTHPIKPGDGVQIQFQSRNIDNWYGKGEPSEAATARMHDLSDAVAIPGLEPAPRKLANYNPTNFELRSEDGKTKIEISPDGKFAFEGAGGSEEIVTILHELLTILETATTTVTYGSSAGIHPLTQNPDYGALKERLAKLKLR